MQKTFSARRRDARCASRRRDTHEVREEKNTAFNGDSPPPRDTIPAVTQSQQQVLTHERSLYLNRADLSARDEVADNFANRFRYPYLFSQARNMSGTSGRRRTADCGIRWSTAMLGTDHVRTTLSRRAAGAGKRALTENPRALSLRIVVIGGGRGGDTARGDAIRVRPLLITSSESSRARDKLVRQLPSAELSNEPSLLARCQALQEKSSNLKLFVAKL